MWTYSKKEYFMFVFVFFHFVIISSFKRSDIGCVKKIVYYFPTCDHNSQNYITSSFSF